jgi:hypothetical protein
MGEGANRNTDVEGLPLSFEEQKLRQESAFREREITLKEQEARRSRWSNPLVLAIFAATVAATGNAAVMFVNNHFQQRFELTRAQQTLDLERHKADAARVLEVIKTTDPFKIRENLLFLERVGLVTDPTIMVPLRQYAISLAVAELQSFPNQERRGLVNRYLEERNFEAAKNELESLIAGIKQDLKETQEQLDSINKLLGRD